jgi:hypothetical protein
MEAAERFTSEYVSFRQPPRAAPACAFCKQRGLLIVSFMAANTYVVDVKSSRNHIPAMLGYYRLIEQ